MQNRIMESLPPLVDQAYKYDPKPVEYWPPVGHERMKHLYYCPKKCKGSTQCLERFPKHCTVNVTVGGTQGDAFAWGLELVEGRDWKFLFVP